MSEVVLTDQNFETEILDDKGVSLVDFWAPWCGPCRMVGPVVEELAKDFDKKAKIGKLNVDENPETAGKYGVMSIPTLIIFKDGEPAESLVGVQSKETIAKKIESLL